MGLEVEIVPVMVSVELRLGKTRPVAKYVGLGVGVRNLHIGLCIGVARWWR